MPASPFAQGPVVLILGDSLSAGYGIDLERGWVALLEQRLQASGLPHQVVNASLSGETSGGGLTRLPALLERHRPAVVVIELGANDGLRGLGLDRLRANLESMIAHAKTAGARVLLIGVRLPPNYGAAYTQGFQGVFSALAQGYGLPLVPDLLQGVAEEWDLMQADALHPTAEAQPRLLDNLWTALEPLLLETAQALGRRDGP
ncbi:arylesterase [Caldichromatium japonicum]|nr:arylesterase [Caldichromatium japonicum]